MLEPRRLVLFDNLHFSRRLTFSRWLFLFVCLTSQVIVDSRALGFWGRFGTSSRLADSLGLLQSWFGSASRLAPSFGLFFCYFLFSRWWSRFRHNFWWVSFFPQLSCWCWLSFEVLLWFWLDLRHRRCFCWESLYGTLVLLLVLFALSLSLQVRILRVEPLLLELLSLLTRQLAQSVLQREAMDIARLVGVSGGCPCCRLPADFLLFCLGLKVADEGTRWRRDGIVNSLNLLVEHVFEILVCLWFRD